MSQVKVRAEIVNREWLEISAILEHDQLKECHFKSNGCFNLLEAAEKFSKAAVGKNLNQLKWGKGKNHWDLLIEEIILKLQNKFALPYTEEELCHCRKIPLVTVDQAIVLGAHTPEKVKAWTSASSGCGTCRPNVEALIKYRIG